MNIFHRIAIKGLLRSRTRTLVTVIGIILSSAMITAVATFVISLQSYLIDGSIAKYGDWHVKFADCDSNQLEALAQTGDVTKLISAQNIGYALLENGQNPDKPYWFVNGFKKEDLNTLSFTLLTGRLPENSNEIVVPAHVTSNGGVGVEVGDTLTLMVGERSSNGEYLSQSDAYRAGDFNASTGENLVLLSPKTYTVVGIMQRPAFEEYSAPGYTSITVWDFTVSSTSFSVLATLKHPLFVHTFIKNFKEGQDISLNENVLRFMGVSNDRLFNVILYTTGVFLILMVMLGSVFLIYNSFHISLNERTQQIGILASVGATARQLRNSVLFEGLCIGIIGIPFGILIGIGSIGWVISVVSQKFGTILYNNIPLQLHISTLAIALAAVFSLITILVSAYLPARKAAAIPIMDCIRQTNEVKAEAKAVSAPAWISRIFGLEGALAMKNFKRNKKRYRSIVLSLALSVILFVCANSFVAYLEQFSEKAVVFTTYDIGIATQNMEDEKMLSLFDKVKDINDLSDASYQSWIEYYFLTNPKIMSDCFMQTEGNESLQEGAYLPMDLQFIDDATYLGILEELGLPGDEYIGANAKAIAVAKMQDVNNVLGEPDAYVDMFANETVSLSIVPESEDQPLSNRERELNLTLVNYVPPDVLPALRAPAPTSYVLQVILPFSAREDYLIEENHFESKGMTFNSENPQAAQEKIETMIKGIGVDSTQYRIYNTFSILEESRNIIFIVNVFAYTFILMISLIAIANVFNTISTNIKLRRRELGMLRSIGMADHSFRKMMNFECLFYGVQTLLFGLPLATLFSSIIYGVLILFGEDETEFVFPAGSMVICIIGVFTIVFITMLYALNEIRKENIIDALRDELA